MDELNDFLHLLVFACGKCACPIAVPGTYSMRNLEQIDAFRFEVKCPCGWTGRLLGLQARQHYVGLWEHQTHPCFSA